MSGNGFTLGIDLIKAPCPECWAHLDTLHTPVEGAVSQCGSCGTSMRSVALDFRGGTQKGEFGIGAFDEHHDELPEPSVVRVMRFAKAQFPDVESIRTRVTQQLSALNKITDNSGAQIQDDWHRNQFLLHLHTPDDFKTQPTRVVRLEAGLYALAQPTDKSLPEALHLSEACADYEPDLTVTRYA